MAAVWIVQVVDNGIEPTPAAVRRFSDVGDGHPYVAYVERAAELGVTQGCGDGSRFCPDDTVTRGQMSAFLVRAFDLPVPAVRPAFADIGDGHRFASEIAALAAAGITIGCGDGSNYCDGATITQRQLRTMLTRGSMARSAAPVVGPVEVTATTTTARTTAVPVRRPAATTTTTTTTTTLPAAADRLINDLVVIERAGLAAIDEEIDVLDGDWCQAGCDNVVVTRDPSVGGARWDATKNRIIFTVPQGVQAPSSLSFDYATDASVADATVTIRITTTSQPVDVLIDKTYNIEHLDNRSFSVDLTDILQGSTCTAGCNNVNVIGPVGVGTLSPYDSTTDKFTYTIADNDDIVDTVMFQFETDDSRGPATVTINIVVRPTFQQIAVGGYFWCGINVEGAIECQGTDEDSVVSRIPGGTDFVGITAGTDHVCARKTDNTVACWGDNSDGESADQGSATYEMVAAGADLTCGIKTTSKEVECWGSNTDGARDGHPASGAHKTVSVGNAAACAIDDNEELICWGNNDDGLQSEPGGAHTAVSVRWQHACAVRKSDGKATCWGSTDKTTTRDGPFVDVETGSSSSCGISASGVIQCWGSNTEGATQVPSGAYSTLASHGAGSCALAMSGLRQCWGEPYVGQVDVPDERFAYVAVGPMHSCGVKKTAEAVCWGLDNAGQASPPAGVLFDSLSVANRFGCGVKTDGEVVCWDNAGSAKATANSGVFAQVATAQESACARKTDGSVECWGSNLGGQTTPTSGASYTHISAANAFSYYCGIKTDKTRDCWGYDLLGTGLITPGGGNFTALSAGFLTACGVHENGSLDCWGRNTGANQSMVPPAGNDYEKVSVGNRHACAVKTDWTLDCWGDDSYGKASPPSGSDFTAVAAGEEHSCALTSDDNIICWGVTTHD